MVTRHRAILGLILLGNAVLFAGVDPPTRFATAALALLLALDLKRLPAVPRSHRLAAAVLLGLVVVQLTPLPEAVRRVLQPGFAEVMHGGWAPLSLAPWATVQVAASAAVAAVLALTAARVAATRSGLPLLLALLAGTGTLLAILGLAGEAGAPERVLLVRDNTGGGGPYGPYVNENHFAQGIELTVPAALVLLAVGARQLRQPGSRRQLAAVTVLGAAVATAVATAALLRSGSRGGAMFLVAAAVLTLPLWLRPPRTAARRWPAVVAAVLLLVVVGVLSWTRLPALEEGLKDLLVIEGVDGNDRWDLWSGTLASWRRSPVVGSGLGSYRHVIGMDKPATASSVLEQAHNDWLEWAATGGAAGVAVLGLGVAGVAAALRPRRVRRRRYELRYPLAAVALVMAATALHETVGFGLQTPLNRYLFAVWLGLLWGLGDRVIEGGVPASRRDARPEGDAT
jgi:hypothetical protein